MKRGFKKSLALLLAVFMTFGAVPFFAVGMIASAEAKYTLKSISITPDTVGVDKVFSVGDTKELQVSGAYQNDANPDDIMSKSIDAGTLTWSTSDSTKVTVSSEGKITAVATTEKDEPVIITALEKVSMKMAECAVTVTKAPVPVKTIMWTGDWATATDMAFLAGKTYSFKDTYVLIPEKPDDPSVTLTCTPETALAIDNENQKFKVNPITTEKLVVTLTLTANGAADSCQPITKQITVYNDVPLKSIAWDYAVGTTGKTLFKYYESVSGIKTPAEYYYELYNPETKKTTYKYHTDPTYARDVCDITVATADKRIVTFDEETKRLIPVGNGEAKITISATTPKGVVKRHTIIAVVQDSPYTPVSSLAIGYDKSKTDSDATYDSASNTIELMYTHSIQLTATPNTGAKLDQKPIRLEMSDGRFVTIVPETKCTWKSSDESVATVDSKTGKVTVTGAGTATITVSVDDNGTVITKEVKIKGKMTWWEALVGVFMSLFSGKWNKIPVYFKALFAGI